MAEFNAGPGGPGVGAPKCSAEYSPNSGGYAAGMYESAGTVGEKEPMPGTFASQASDDGAHDSSALSAFNSQHGRPAISAVPDNATGSIESGNPTAAEGATGPY